MKASALVFHEDLKNGSSSKMEEASWDQPKPVAFPIASIQVTAC